RSDDAGQSFSPNAKLAVSSGAGRKDHGIVEREQFVQPHVASDFDIAEEVNAIAREHAIKDARHVFCALVVGCYAVPDKPEWNRKLFQDVDECVRNNPKQVVGEVTTRRTAANDCNMHKKRSGVAAGAAPTVMNAVPGACAPGSKIKAAAARLPWS